MGRLLLDLPYRASTNNYPKFFPYPLLLMKIQRPGDELLDLNLKCRDMNVPDVKRELDGWVKALNEDGREVVVSCGHFPADADKNMFFDYFLSKLSRPVVVTGVYPSVMMARVSELHGRHQVQTVDWDISDVEIPLEMIEQYPRVGKKLRASIRATHGCPRKCGMCPAWLIYRKSFRVWPIENTVSRIRKYYDEGVRFITFIDDNLTVSPKFDVLLEQLAEENLKGMEYICQEGFEVTSFHRDRMCQLLKRVKFVDMKMAVENVNRDVLVQIDKYYKDFSVVEQALKNIQRYELEVGSYFLFGLEKTEEEVLNNIRFIAENALDVRVNVVRPYEGGVVKEGEVNEHMFRSFSSLAYAASWYARTLGVNIMSPDALDQLKAAGYNVVESAGKLKVVGKTDHYRMTSRFVRGLKWMGGQWLGRECQVLVREDVVTITGKPKGFGL